MTTGLFVTGTDTEVGKTVASACLVRALGADYWKPVQTGTDELPEGDTGTVAALAGLTGDRIVPPVHTYRAPLSPDQAASLEGGAVHLADFTLPERARPLVVEGAGGLLVPLDDRHLMIDLIARLGLPTVLVARTGLGTINHTLLSLEALGARKLPVAGIVLVGEPKPMNRAAIAHFGGVPILGEIPPLTPLNAATVTEAAARLTLPKEISG